MLKLIVVFWSVLIISSTSSATDHNEPELLSGFYSNVDGSGADIYGLFGYPSPDGETLNVIMTLAPVPETGKFDPKSIHRIYFSPSRVLEIDGDNFLRSLSEPNESTKVFLGLTLINPFEILKRAFTDATSFEKDIVRPIAENAYELFNLGAAGNNLPFDQKVFPEIRATYNSKGTWAKIEFKNFLFNDANPKDRGAGQVLVKSNGVETDPAKLKTYTYNGMKVFAGGRDDPFYSDIGGFFRSIHFSAALKKDDDFTWKGTISSHATAAEKEQSPRMKALIDRQTHHGVYDGTDWRAGNNVNTLAFTIPVAYLTARRDQQRVIRMWAEGFVTEDEYRRLVSK